MQARGSALALYELYGALLTEHQLDVVDLYLRSDWSLAEIAAQQGTSRAAVHDIVRRSTRALQDYENYELTSEGATILTIRVLFFFVAAILVNRFAMENRRQGSSFSHIR